MAASTVASWLGTVVLALPARSSWVSPLLYSARVRFLCWPIAVDVHRAVVQAAQRIRGEPTRSAALAGRLALCVGQLARDDVRPPWAALCIGSCASLWVVYWLPRSLSADTWMRSVTLTVASVGSVATEVFRAETSDGHVSSARPWPCSEAILYVPAR